MLRVKVSKARPVSKGVASKLDHILFLCRVLYNAALEERISAYKKLGISLSYFDQCKELTILRSQDPIYDALDATMLRLTVLFRLDKAFKAFFARCKTGKKPGFPRFKGKYRFQTLVFSDSGWKLSGNKIWITGVGQIRLTSVPEIRGPVKGLRLVRSVSGWRVHLIQDIGEVPETVEAVNHVGIDVGLKTFAVLSDGSKVKNPRFVKETLDDLKSLQRDVSAKKRGSNNRRKAKLKLARLHEKIKNRRDNFLHQESRKIVDKYDGFSVEKLDIQEMVDSDREIEGLNKKGERGLRRGIMDAAWARFDFFISYKAEEAGKKCKEVVARGTSQKCCNCGSIVKKTLRDRQHICPCCGLVMDRDLNAAVNIDNLGWRLVA